MPGQAVSWLTSRCVLPESRRGCQTVAQCEGDRSTGNPARPQLQISKSPLANQHRKCPVVVTSSSSPTNSGFQLIDVAVSVNAEMIGRCQSSPSLGGNAGADVGGPERCCCLRGPRRCGGSSSCWKLRNPAGARRKGTPCFPAHKTADSEVRRDAPEVAPGTSFARRGVASAVPVVEGDSGLAEGLREHAATAVSRPTAPPHRSTPRRFNPAAFNLFVPGMLPAGDHDTDSRRQPRGTWPSFLQQKLKALYGWDVKPALAIHERGINEIRNALRLRHLRFSIGSAYFGSVVVSSHCHRHCRRQLVQQRRLRPGSDRQDGTRHKWVSLVVAPPKRRA